MNLTGRRIYQKTPKPAKAQGLRPKSKKRAAAHRSIEGQEGLIYMATVKTLPCVACGASGCDAHHCRDLPPSWSYDPYDQRPGAGQKSGYRDTTPLCPSCHQNGPKAYHRDRTAFRAKHGPDYLHIMPARALVDARLGEIDF